MKSVLLTYISLFCRRKKAQIVRFGLLQCEVGAPRSGCRRAHSGGESHSKGDTIVVSGAAALARPTEWMLL